MVWSEWERSLRLSPTDAPIRPPDGSRPPLDSESLTNRRILEDQIPPTKEQMMNCEKERLESVRVARSAVIWVSSVLVSQVRAHAGRLS
jgi:hypothetical protein